MAPPTSSFAFALCQPGTERWLKAEIARDRPDLRAAFQRPGLVTFKTTRTPFRPDERPTSVFGRVWGCSEGPTKTPEEVVAIAQRLGVQHLWVGPRDAGVPGDVPPALDASVQRHAAQLRGDLQGLWKSKGGARSASPRNGDLVLDVVTWPEDPIHVGWHTHGPGRHTTPCGRYDLERPTNAPSRAWLKIEEAIRWFDLDLKKGELVLEIGASPGGGTRALLDRGLRVLAIDPQPLDESLLTEPNLRWERTTASHITAPDDTAWIVCDANIPPADIVPAVARLSTTPKLRGVIVTLKLGSESAVRTLQARIDALVAAVGGSVRAVQLPSHRQECVAVVVRS